MISASPPHASVTRLLGGLNVRAARFLVHAHVWVAASTVTGLPACLLVLLPLVGVWPACAPGRPCPALFPGCALSLPSCALISWLAASILYTTYILHAIMHSSLLAGCHRLSSLPRVSDGCASCTGPGMRMPILARPSCGVAHRHIPCFSCACYCPSPPVPAGQALPRRKGCLLRCSLCPTMSGLQRCSRPCAGLHAVISVIIAGPFQVVCSSLKSQSKRTEHMHTQRARRPLAGSLHTGASSCCANGGATTDGEMIRAGLAVGRHEQLQDDKPVYSHSGLIMNAYAC